MSSTDNGRDLHINHSSNNKIPQNKPVVKPKSTESKVLKSAMVDEANGKLFSLYYLDKNKATTLLQVARVPMPKMPVTRSDGFVHSITEPNSPVKKKIDNVTESLQFKRWFGDWHNITNQQSGVKGSGNNLSLITQTTDGYTVSDLFNIVKQSDTNFQPKPVSEALLNDDGTPCISWYKPKIQRI